MGKHTFDTGGMRRMVMTMMAALTTTGSIALAQFSPGELSRPHHALEGSQNCTKCHEVGKEISGKKCLVCHEEIREAIDSNHGLHALSSLKRCVECHKEHLGLDAKTMVFDQRRFDHTTAGFTLTGKHTSLACDRCHTRDRIKNPGVLAFLRDHPRSTFLGLEQACISCHRDPHAGQFDRNCASCHNTTAWTPAQNFDHAKTRFPLTGKHVQVECSKCHQSMAMRKQGMPVDMSTPAFTDCAPCHRTPHSSGFRGGECRTCHTPSGWNDAISRPFDHTVTRYALTGMHARLRCEQCHRETGKKNFSEAFLLPHDRCIDCHADKHEGAFLARYKNDCSRCHTVQGYIPSTFTPADHQRGRFTLTGAHMAVPCGACHRPSEHAAMVFRFTDIRCEACHRDVHRGEFASSMKSASCGACHSTARWSVASFDHSTTRFPLEGKHAGLLCADCHHEQNGTPSKTVNFAALSTECQACHRDIHRDQFAENGSTRCNKCHTVKGWASLVFNHETQTTFSLTGAHTKVPCAGCHPRVADTAGSFIRFKPIASACESCHTTRRMEQ